ncbi:S8 family peptidase [Flavobacterium sp.]|uniref:S8 family peptidase n=1 Tax=Flavobacterium sp. TaxID=239 RepID=UPI0039E71FEA
MRKIITFLFLALASPIFSQETVRYTERDLIVKLTEAGYEQADVDPKKRNFGIASLDNLNLEIGIADLRPIGQPDKTRTFVIGFQNPIDAVALASRYKQLGIFEYTTPNCIGSAGGNSTESAIIPNDPRFAIRQWGLYNPGTQTGIGPVVEDADVDMELAWDIQTGDPDMIIAVVDGGARMGHPDFASRIWTNPGETANGLDDDGNGLVDDLTGWDWFFNDNDTTDERGHGMNVCGIIGAVSNNNNLFAGANWNSKIMVLKSINYDLNATYESVANAVYYAVDKGAKIINFSIGFNPQAQVLEDFVAYAGNHNVIISACMMNFNNNTVYYPAGYSLTHTNIIACGSTSANDYRTVPFDWSPTSGSNYGSHISVAAPGSYIYQLAHNNDLAGGVYWSGTSMATPLVASIASLVWAEAPQLTPAEVRSIIQNTAQDQVGNPSEDTVGFDNYMGYGRANAHAAVMAAQALSASQFNATQAQEFQMINPVQKDRLQVSCKGQYPGRYTVMVNAMDGKLIESKDIEIKSGLNEVPFSYPRGNYIVTLQSQAYTKIFKVLKE